MFGIRMFAVVGLLALTGCSLIGKGKSGVSSSVPGASGLPGGGPKAEASDPGPVQNAIERLDKMEKLIEARTFGQYAGESRRFNSELLFEDSLKDAKKRGAIQNRLVQLDAAAFKAFGGRLAAVGDAKRVLKLDNATAQAATELIDSCDEAAKTQSSGPGAAAELAKRIRAYEAQLARLSKMDATALRYYGETNTRYGTIDIPTRLMLCETALVDTEAHYADAYEEESASSGQVETDCGVVDWSVRGVAIGRGKFAPYERTEGGASYPERMACNKLQKKSKYPASLRAAAQDLAEFMGMKLGDLVIVLDGAPKIETNEDDLNVYRYQYLKAYSKQWKFSGNACGKDKMLFCEAGGSKGAKAYNQLEHALARATVHAGKSPDRCNQHLQIAKAAATDFAEFRADSIKRGSWQSGATYKTKKGEKLPEKEFVAAFEAKGKLADDRIVEKYCAKPQK